MAQLFANQNYGGIQSEVINIQSISATQANLDYLNVSNLNVVNSPSIGSTIIASPPAYIYNSPVPSININSWIFLLVDSNENNIQLPITSNTFFTGITIYYNLFGPGTGGSWITNPGMFIGTSPINATGLSNTICSGNITGTPTFYPMTFPQNGQVVQVGQFLTGIASTSGGTAGNTNTNKSYFTQQLCNATSTTNYLSAGFGAVVSWNVGTGNCKGKFTVYLTYMSLF